MRDLFSGVAQLFFVAGAATMACAGLRPCLFPSRFIIFTLIFNAPISAPFYVCLTSRFLPAAAPWIAPSFFNGSAKTNCAIWGWFLVGGAVLGLVNWSLPLVRLLHKISPPVQAIRSLAARLDGAKDKLLF
ncbi:MAG: hypothetical protein U0Y68_01275 [Blastocatellia bacterium]